MTMVEGAHGLREDISVPQDAIDGFRLDGAVLLKGYFRDWVEPLRAGIERNLAEPGPYQRVYTPKGGSGRFVGDGKWQLENVKTTQIGADGTKVSTVPSMIWETVLRPSILNVYQVAPERLDLNALYDNIRVLTTNAQKTSRFEIAFWNKVFYPAAVLVMMMLALPFAHFQRRQGGVGFRIFAGTMLGLTFFLLGRLFSNLGLLNDWPPLFSAAFPLVVFVTVAASMLWWIERR